MGKRVRITQDIFINRCMESHKESRINFSKSKFTTSNNYVTYTCATHGDKEMRARHLMRGVGCPDCAKEKQTEDKYLTTEEFKKRAQKIHPTLNFDGVEYTGTREIIEVQCDKGHKFSIIPNNVLNGRGCPKCTATKSGAEGDLAKYVKGLVENVVENDRYVIGPKELDIVIPEHKVAIELDGLYWHNDRNVPKKYHLDKTVESRREGYRLIHIFEDEWRDKRSIVESRIKSILGKTEYRIYGRQTEVKEIAHQETKEFLDDNHIQGSVNSKIKLGLFFEGELVSVMTLGPLRKALGSKAADGHYELLRFCNKKETVVVGGASKLLKYFEKKYVPKEIISYADYRWSEGDLYKTLGFTYCGLSKPNYYYLPTRSDQRLSRYPYRKSELVKEGYPKEKTEKQIMEERGFSRIYDCGALKYKLTYGEKKINQERD